MKPLEYKYRKSGDMYPSTLHKLTRNQRVRDEDNNLYVVDRHRGNLLYLVAINSDGSWRGDPDRDRFLTANIDPYSKYYKKIYPHKLNMKIPYKNIKNKKFRR